MMRPYINIVVFDTETTGLDPVKDEMLSIAWVKVRKYMDGKGEEVQYVERAEYFIFNDEVKNSVMCLKINGIDDEFRHEYGVSVQTALDRFKHAINGCYVFAFNIAFDEAFVKKYDPTTFEGVAEMCEIRCHQSESVLNAIQRIVFYYYQRFDHNVYVAEHLHTAFDDVNAELVIVLHDIFLVDVRKWLVRLDKDFIPSMGSGKFKNVRIDWLIKNEVGFVKWFLFNKESPHEDYLRDYILENWIVKIKPTDMVLKNKMNSYYMLNDCHRLIVN